jgi:hypothetical protein
VTAHHDNGMVLLTGKDVKLVPAAVQRYFRGIGKIILNHIHWELSDSYWVSIAHPRIFIAHKPRINNNYDFEDLLEAIEIVHVITLWTKVESQCRDRTESVGLRH